MNCAGLLEFKRILLHYTMACLAAAVPIVGKVRAQAPRSIVSFDQSQQSLLVRESEQELKPNELERLCGRDSLYILLRLMNNDVAYSNVEEALRVTEEGSSLADMARASQYCDAPLDLIQTDPVALTRIAVPAIAHLWLRDGGQRMGHYVILLKVDHEGVKIADGTSLFVGRVSWADFLDKWSGYLLVPTNPVRTKLERGLTLLNLLLLIGLTFYGVRSRRKISTKPVGTCIICGIMLAISGCGKQNEPMPSLDGTSPTSGRGGKILSIPELQKDLKIVELGTSAEASFNVTNVSGRVLKLSLGYPSCKCLTATLTKDEIAPGESSRVTMVVSTAHEAGWQIASVTLGTTEPEGVWRFQVRAVIEGLVLDPYTLRVPEGGERIEPEPLTGRLVVGSPDRHVEIIRTQLMPSIEGDLPGLTVGKPDLSERDNYAGFMSYLVRIPIHVLRDSSPPVGSYPLRLDYRIGDMSAQTGTQIRVVPLQHLPRSDK